MTGLQIGSRPWKLAQLERGESLALEVPLGVTVTRYMQQIGVDIGRVGLRGQVVQQHFLAIQPTTRQVIDFVRITKD